MFNNHSKILFNHTMKINTSNSQFFKENLITALQFSHSGQFCCLATKKDIKTVIFRVKDIAHIDTWEFLQEMHEQTQPISEIDWSKDDKIIAGSHDRSVFVYKRSGNNSWQKMLVNIDIKLSILCAKWAPSTKKFGLGSSCRTLALGFYNVQSNCWTVSSRQKFTKSPITSISFHPSSNLIAVGSSDNSVKIVSCSFKQSKDPFVQKSDVEDKHYHGPFQNIDTLFDTLYAIDDVGGWVNHLSFELNGSFLLILPHNTEFRLLDIGESGKGLQAKQTKMKWNGLPFLSGYISDKGVLYAGGFDKKVAVFNRSSGGFTFSQYLQNNQKSSAQKSKKGIVSSMLHGIEKRDNNLKTSEMELWEHANAIKILPSSNRKYVVSYDINGIIHFWS